MKETGVEISLTVFLCVYIRRLRIHASTQYNWFVDNPFRLQ
jgi:hypothetical protein